MTLRRLFPALLLTAACALPVCGFSQGSPMMPAQGAVRSGSMVAPADVLRKIYEGQMREFISLAEAMPADKFNFAPSTSMGNFAGVRTFADQIKHVTSANYGFFQGWNIPGAMSRADIAKLQSRDQILQALKDSYAYVGKAIDTITPQNALVDMDGKGETRFGTVAYLLAHNNDHYGQMVEYLRMNGQIPPASRR